MTAAEFLTGICLVTLVAGPLLFGAGRLRRRMLPGWGGARGALVDIVLGLSHLIVMSQLLGTFGLFRATFLVPAMAISGLAVGMVAGTGRRGHIGAGPRLASLDRTGVALAAAGLAVVAARWALPTANAYETGILEDDSIAYHLPFAARFVQEGGISDLHFAVPEIPMAFYPANADLVHALGMLTFGGDILSPAMNLAWLLLLLLAGWCLGRSFGAAPAVIAGLAAIAGSPLVVTSQAGSAHNDLAGAALLLTAGALLHIGWRERWAVVIAGLAAGLAIGVKFTLLLPAAALSLGVALLAWRERRFRLVAGWLAALGATGGYWYVRNLAHTGSPIPPVRLGIGPLAFPKIEHAVEAADLSIMDYADQPRLVWHLMSTAAFEAFGPLWPLLLFAILGGIVLAAWRPRDPVHRMLGLVAAVSAVGYLFTPATAFGPPGNPTQVYATANVRYALPAIVLALAVLPLSPTLAHRRWQLGLTTGLTALALSMHTARSFIWVAWLRGVSILPGVIAGAAVLAATAALGLRRDPLSMRARLALVGSVVLCIGGGGVILADWYSTHRYRDDPTNFGAIYSWAQDVEGKRIGVVGSFRHYPLYGSEQENYVQYVGRVTDGARFREIRNCDEWRLALVTGSYDYVVAMPNREGEPAPKQAAWTRSAPEATEILRRGAMSVFRIDGPGRTSCSNPEKRGGG